ncbi:MAG: radical SAM protein [Pirellulales bacterium]|nr:radical SAM protein [Pirellulales bacterium]
MGLLHRLFTRDHVSARHKAARLLRGLGFVSPPEAVQWIATSMCDLHCPHCYSHAGAKQPGELTKEEACRLIVDELVKLQRPTFVVAGGEALLRRDFEAVIRYAHQRRVPWALHSHGGWIEREIGVFRECPPLMVAVSLDGPREFHDRFRGQAGSFDAALRAMKLLKDAGCGEVVAGTTITRGNADLLADMASVVMRSAADSWGLHLVTPEGRAGDHAEILPTAVQLRRVAAFARRMRSVMRVELDNEWGSAGDDDCFYRNDAFMCGAGRFSCVVSATGEVMPCTTTDPGESQGNVRQAPLSRIWADGFAAFRTRADPLRSDPYDCWLQTRNGRSCRSSFAFDPFGETATLDTLRPPSPLYELTTQQN